MDIDSIVKALKKDNSTNRALKKDNSTNSVIRTEFVNFMENVKDPYLVLICCILSLRTNDKTTYPASMRMLALGKTPKEISGLDIKTLEEAIYPVGFYIL